MTDSCSHRKNIQFLPVLTLLGGRNIGQQHGIPMGHLGSTFQPSRPQGFGESLRRIQRHQLLVFLEKFTSIKAAINRFSLPTWCFSYHNPIITCSNSFKLSIAKTVQSQQLAASATAGTAERLTKAFNDATPAASVQSA